jgi:magnesium-dependent phosphatase 1
MLVVFDLDFTLWNAGGTWCDQTVPPYRRKNGHVEDGEGRMITLYPDVKGILAEIQNRELPMALASRTYSPATADRLLEMLEISHFFKYRQIFPGSKVPHFERLQKETGTAFRDMFFFDDEERNIAEVGRLNVRTRRVMDGLTWNDVESLLGNLRYW